MVKLTKVQIVFTVACIVGLTACNPQNKYVLDAIDIIQEHSIKKEQIDWGAYKSKVLKYGKNDKTIDDYHKTITYALLLLKDGHSFLVSSENMKKEYSDTTMKRISPIVSDYKDEIGYIKIPEFIGNKKLENAYATRIRDLIKNLDKHKISGWIIDLRDNGGGNMWPMLLGIGPILGDGIAGYFVNDKKEFKMWGYSEGKTFVGGSIISQTDSAYQLINTNKKIAVLINNKTASSGEAIAVAFKGLPKTRFFGEKTRGQTTGNSIFFLSDSSMIALMTSVYADRNKTIYGRQVIPDEGAKDKDAKELAINWINWTMLLKN